jgi:L-alanine-DL-glutamate epimerase-like enolase superfamily enzyme
MKCTGISEALRIVEAAKKKAMKLMIGCMTETSCGILAAAAVAPLFDYADMDGCWLISNNPYPDPVLESGKIVLQQ